MSQHFASYAEDNPSQIREHSNIRALFGFMDVDDDDESEFAEG